MTDDDAHETDCHCEKCWERIASASKAAEREASEEAETKARERAKRRTGAHDKLSEDGIPTADDLRRMTGLWTDA